ncbi:aryl-sulfate sulfotransferase [Saprospiraceae bacterium]|nr:aryl-sulfate sulfotransferase [Saprospiraceae bacterium]
MNKIYGILIIISVLSCNDTTPEVVEMCDQFDEVSAVLDSALENKDFVTSFEDNEDTFVINFNTTDSISIDRECIINFEIINTNTLSLNFEDQRNLSFPYLEFDIFNLEHNPSGWTPLSAALRLNLNIEGTIKVTVLKKDSDGIDLIKTYQHTDISGRYPVLGLYYDHINEIVTEWSDDNIIILDTFYIETPMQPDYMPDINIIKADVNAMEPGMTLISYRVKENPSVPFMIDNTGEVRYILDYDGHPELNVLNFDVGMERLKNGNFYFGHWPTNKLYEVDIFGEVVNKWELAGYTFHHNVQEKENGNLLITVNKDGTTHLNGNNTIEDHIIELDRNTGLVANEWDLRESLDETRYVQSVNSNAEFIDWAHANAVIESSSDNSIIVSCRKQGLIKLNENNEVQWILNNHFRWGENRRGEDLNQYLLTPLDRFGNEITDTEILDGLENHEDFEWNWFQHAPLLLGQRLFCFDNGDRRNYAGGQRYSRAVEYLIDEENMTVQQQWSYGKERGTETYSNIVSDVDYLAEKNNILFAPGAGTNNGVGQFGGRIVEVNYDSKEVVFEMSINGPFIVWHRVERLPIYPD